MALFSECETQAFLSGEADAAAPAWSKVLERDPVAVKNGMRVSLRVTGRSGTQAGTLTVELNHVVLATIAVAADADVSAELVVRRTGDTQAVVRGRVVTDGTAVELSEAAKNGLAWTRPQLFAFVLESDEEGGVALENFGVER